VTESFFEASSAVIPILLLVLATEEKIGFVKPEWRRAGPLHGIALLLGALVVGEVLALGALHRQSTSLGVSAYIITVIAMALVWVVWGIGWSIWTRFPDDVPKAGTWGKKIFYGIGILTFAGIVLSMSWALSS
jgi:hypothetical protein